MKITLSICLFLTCHTSFAYPRSGKPNPPPALENMVCKSKNSEFLITYAGKNQDKHYLDIVYNFVFRDRAVVVNIKDGYDRRIIEMKSTTSLNSMKLYIEDGDSAMLKTVIPGVAEHSAYSLTCSTR